MPNFWMPNIKRRDPETEHGNLREAVGHLQYIDYAAPKETPDAPWDDGDYVEITVTAGALRDIRDYLDSVTKASR